MRKYFIYLMIYSFLGFILERIINVIFLGYYYDNSVLIGPYQPLYGVGILMAIIIYDLFLKRVDTKLVMYGLLLIVSIITTGLSEFITGEGYELITNTQLWDYNQTFNCEYPYVCIFPTSLFGFFSFLVIVFIHPFVKLVIKNTPRLFIKWTFRIVLFVFVIDILYTFIFRL